MPYLYLIRHPHTRVDPARQPHEWDLSDLGLEQVKALSKAPFWTCVRGLYASPQPKALIPAKIFGSEYGLPVTAMPELAEIGRGPAGYISAADYHALLQRFFSEPNARIAGWEQSQSALDRFHSAVQKIIGKPPNQSVAILSHGTILTLYTAMLDNAQPTLERWRAIDFAAVSVVDLKTMQRVTNFVTDPYDSVPIG